jgi:hypothetical protein
MKRKGREDTRMKLDTERERREVLAARRALVLWMVWVLRVPILGAIIVASIWVAVVLIMSLEGGR